MSVPYLPGNFKSKEDEQEKIRYYEALLELRRRLNLENEKSSEFIQEQMDTGVPTAPVPYRPIEEQINDMNSQRRLAIKNAQITLSPGDASQFVNTYLNSLNELVLFNRYYEKFFNKYLKDVRMVTPFFMNQQWNKFKGDLASTTETGTSPEVPTYETSREIVRQAVMDNDTYDKFVNDLKNKIPGLGRNDPTLFLRRLYGEVWGVRPSGTNTAIFDRLRNRLRQQEVEI